VRVAVIGTGLVGGSLAAALRRLDEVGEVVGADADPAQLALALERGLVDRIAASAQAAAEGADLVVLAVPVSAVVEVAKQVGSVLAPGAILTDVASVKGSLVPQMEAAVAPGVSVLGGHPMAGSHETGAVHATPDLFVGATYLLTPTPATDPEAYRRLHGLLAGIGARVLAVDLSRHDLLVAVVSHLPQLAATTLMNLAAGRASAEHAELLLLAAGGFRDATRVAASNPDLWVDIIAENRDAIVAVLDDYRERVGALRSLVAVGDEGSLRAELAAARAARRNLPGRKTITGALVELHVPIPDRPGVIAEVATGIGSAGVNIEDLAIEHAPSGGQGTMRLAIIGFAQAGKARAALEAKGYDVTEIVP
jgi:prephenate dehydrogenase